MRWFARSGLLERDDAGEMLTSQNSGFSIDATVRIAGQCRADLESFAGVIRAHQPNTVTPSI